MELKEVLDFLFGENAKEIDSIDKVKEKFTGKNAMFVSVAELDDPKSEIFKKRFVPKAVGQISNRITSTLKKKLADLDIEISPDEIKEKEIEDVVESLMTKTVSTVKSRIGELDGKLKQNTDERVTSLTADLQKVNQKYTDLDNLHKSLKETYDKETAAHKSELNGFKVQTLRDQYHTKHIKFGAAVKDLEKEGYHARIDSKYKLELNDKGDDLDVFDRKTGSRIPGKQAGTFKTYGEVLEDEGEAANLWGKNEGARRMNQLNSTFANNPSGQPTNEGGAGGQQQQQRRVSSRVMQGQQ